MRVIAFFMLASVAAATDQLAAIGPAAPKPGTVELTILDSATNQPVPARVLVRDASGVDHVPASTVEVPIGKDRWFVTGGKTLLAVPAGSVSIRIERGTEYRPARLSVPVTPRAVARREIAIERWIDMRGLWYSSGKKHLHVPVSRLGPMLAAVDLNVGNPLYWWNGLNLEMPAGPEAFRRLPFAGREILSSGLDGRPELRKATP